ncbi:hypothetical protein HYFRA_00009005 [Hymenoscyphus fraxineus]|uniref:Uncharacterized protein n=1 Tax=Hymenoscyphus fraxineus TaxID=746836 RepID=A0A9N9PMU9_9HELO|nr:hypothetical protein HYFRA_00009005 [Hymenoscyphus fraxineus]
MPPNMPVPRGRATSRSPSPPAKRRGRKKLPAFKSSQHLSQEDQTFVLETPSIEITAYNRAHDLYAGASPIQLLPLPVGPKVIAHSTEFFVALAALLSCPIFHPPNEDFLKWSILIAVYYRKMRCNQQTTDLERIVVDHFVTDESVGAPEEYYGFIREIKAAVDAAKLPQGKQTTSKKHRNVKRGDLQALIVAWDQYVADHPESGLSTVAVYQSMVPNTRRSKNDALQVKNDWLLEVRRGEHAEEETASAATTTEEEEANQTQIIRADDNIPDSPQPGLEPSTRPPIPVFQSSFQSASTPTLSEPTLAESRSRSATDSRTVFNAPSRNPIPSMADWPMNPGQSISLYPSQDMSEFDFERMPWSSPDMQGVTSFDRSSTFRWLGRLPAVDGMYCMKEYKPVLSKLPIGSEDPTFAQDLEYALKHELSPYADGQPAYEGDIGIVDVPPEESIVKGGL